MTVAPRPLSALLAALLLATTGCGTTCPEIAEHRAAFLSRAREGTGADARLTVPLRLFDAVIAGHLARRPPVRVSLPVAQLGLALSLTAVLERVHVRPAAPGRIGVAVELGLFEGPTRAVALTLETELAPRFHARDGASPAHLALTLSPRDLSKLTPRSTPEGRAAFGRWLRAELPPIARPFASDEVLDAVTDDLLGFLADEAWPRVRNDVLGPEPLIDTQIALPDLAIREIATRSRPDAVVFDLTTGYPGAAELPAREDAVAGTRMALRMSGPTATGLINQHMASGEIPARFSTDGEPDPHGPWEARVGWRGGKSPLLVHLWRTSGTCERAEVAAQVALSLSGDALAVRVREGRFVSVAGPAFAEAFAWLDSLFGKAMAFGFETDALLRFDTEDSAVQVRLARVALVDDLLLELDLGVTSR